MTADVESLYAISEIEHRCRELLARDVWDFISGGSGTESALAANIDALSEVHLVPRVLRDVSTSTCRSELVNTDVTMPVAVAPMAYQRLVHSDGELATARAAKDAGIPFTVTTLSSVAIERIAEVGGPMWFQLYWLRDRATMFDLVQRADGAGCTAIMLTVDVPWMGRRLRDVRNRFALPAEVVAANLTGARTLAHDDGIAAHTSAAFDPSLSWPDLAELRAATRLPVIVKGVLHPDDAARLIEVGVDAVVVSNHGGRQLDGAASGVALLPIIRDAVGDRATLLVDGGIRNGVDVVKALALGADGVLIGRPVLWGLGVAGEVGVRRVLRLIADELADSLGLAGCSSVADARHLGVMVRQCLNRT
jgi:4-hydroxymandelate oxidase